jgi:hypothetical protein
MVICILIGEVALESSWGRRKYVIPKSFHYQGVDCAMNDALHVFWEWLTLKILNGASIGEPW